MSILEFISEMENKMAKLTDNITSGKLRAIEGSIERLKQIEEQLNVQKYRLVFIGEPGSGKPRQSVIFSNLRLTPKLEISLIVWNYLKLRREEQQRQKCIFKEQITRHWLSIQWIFPIKGPL